MAETGNTRRTTLKIMSAIGTTCAFPFSAEELFGQQEHDHVSGVPHYTAPAVAPFEPQFFTAAEGLAVARLCDLIIPQTETPGAVAAGVPHYIDQIVMRNPEHQKLFREGIQWMNSHGKPFVEMTETEQIAILQPLSDSADGGKMDADGVAFFHAIKNMTADGYYTSYAGLVQELGYKGNQALASFEGCVHEH